MIDDCHALHGLPPARKHPFPSLTRFSTAACRPAFVVCDGALRQVPPCRILASGKVQRSMFSRVRHDVGEPIEQRTVSAAPPRFRIDAVLALRRGRVAQRQHAGVDEQPAVAVFREAGEPVDVGDLDAGPLQRLDQRIGRATATACAAARGPGFRRRSAAPDAASSRRAPRQSVSRDGQIGPRCVSSSSGMTGAAMRLFSTITGQMIEQAAGARRVRASEKYPGAAITVRPSRLLADRRARPSPSSGLRSETWNPRPSFSSVSSASAAASARNGSSGRDENSPSRNMARLASARPSERPTL